MTPDYTIEDTSDFKRIKPLNDVATITTHVTRFKTA
jgi:hypothetical protein